MRKLQVVCKGSYSLMLDRMPDDVLDHLIDKIKRPVKTDRSDKEVAAEKIYRDAKGRIGIPATMLLAAMVTAGREVPYKKRTMISTAETTKLFGLIEIPQEFLTFPIPEGKTETPWEVDKRRGILRVGSSETAVGLRRPKFEPDDWGFTCDVIYDDDEISEGTVRELFRIAGRFQGIGSFRPNCKGPFGRFVVSSLVDITPQEMVDESRRNKDSGSRKAAVEEPVSIDSEGKLESIGVNGKGKKPRKSRLAEVIQ